MQPSYINYAEFDKTVLKEVKHKVYQLNKHFLPQIKLIHRARFIETLRKCGDISVTSSIIHKGNTLPDKHFLRFSDFMLAKHRLSTAV